MHWGLEWSGMDDGPGTRASDAHVGNSLACDCIKEINGGTDRSGEKC